MGLMRGLGGRTGAGFFLHGILVLALQADTALVGWLGGAQVAAQFYLVWRIAEALIQVIWKLPELLSPYFVQMDVRGEHDTLARIARWGYGLIGLVAVLTGLFYALWGSVLVAWWVGPVKTPVSPWGYALAGGAIVWLSLSRLPVVLASARLVLGPLNKITLYELLGKLLLVAWLFPKLGYLAVLIGTNVVHLLGVAYLYFGLLHRTTQKTFIAR
jgi:O-antigen/teichoic acid export membrane protein